MKVSVELDAEVVEEAMKATGAQSKEDAIYIALQSVSKADWLKDFSVVGPFPPPEEWKDAVSPDYNPKAPYSGNSPFAHDSANVRTYETAAAS